MNPAIARHITAIGLVAGTMTTLSFLPQLVRTLRLRRASDISALWLASFISGVALWLIYGLMVSSFPIVVANAATLVLTLPILALKICYRE